MNNALNWFEIATKDIDRAARFYEQMLGVTLKKETFGGSPMAIFPADADAVAGALVSDVRRKPGAGGALVYLSVNGKLDACIARVAASGGKIVVGKTDIGPMGDFALFEDTEGNVVGLHAEK